MTAAIMITLNKDPRNEVRESFHSTTDKSLNGKSWVRALNKALHGKAPPQGLNSNPL